MPLINSWIWCARLCHQIIQLKIACCYVWTDEETEHFFHKIIKEKNITTLFFFYGKFWKTCFETLLDLHGMMVSSFNFNLIGSWKKICNAYQVKTPFLHDASGRFCSLILMLGNCCYCSIATFHLSVNCKKIDVYLSLVPSERMLREKKAN